MNLTERTAGERLPATLFHGLGKLFVEKLYGVLDGGILIHHVLNRLAGMNDGAMITPAEGTSYFLKRVLGENAGKVHRDLTGESYVCGPPSRKHVGHPKVIVVHDLLLNRLDRDATEVFFGRRMSRSNRWTVSRSAFFESNPTYPATRVRAPSMRRTLLGDVLARNSIISGSTAIPMALAFLVRMATRVSKSGA